jgi:Uma2 family endonuclease
MDVIDQVPAGEFIPTADQRVVMHGVPWAHYAAIVALRGEKAVPRIAYLDGAMELMSPSRTHESIKSYLGTLIEAFALARGIRFTPYGSWTLQQPEMAGAEPDECYLFGDQRRDVPDLAIEVVWTSGGINKLEIYRRLGISEVWFWTKPNQITVYRLTAGAYQRVEASTFLPGLDIGLVCSLLDQPTAFDAVQALRATLT